MPAFTGSPLRPRWVYNDGAPVDYLMSIPQRPYDMSSRGFGGSDVSAAGVPAAFEIRRDNLLRLTLRFPEHEWDDVERVVRHLQLAGSATFYPDQDDTSIVYTVYGESPAMGSEIRPRRSDFPRVLELDVTIRRTTDVIFDDPFFSDALLYWLAGTDVTGSVFTRASVATYIDVDGVLRTAASGVRRWTYLGANGSRVPHLLLGAARTNAWTRSEQMNDAAWTKNRSSISADAAVAPDGLTTMDKLVEDGTTGFHTVQREPPAMTNDTDQTVSFHVSDDERSWWQIRTIDKGNNTRDSWVDSSDGSIGTTDAGHTIRLLSSQAGVYRFSVTFDSSNGGTTPDVLFALATGDGVSASYAGDNSSGANIWGLQFEADASFASSYIPTVGSTETRALENLNFAYTSPPQEMTAYIKFVYVGFTSRPLHIGRNDNKNTKPHFYIDETGSGFRATHNNGSSGVTATLSVLPVAGDLEELLVVLGSDGSVSIEQSIKGAAVTSASSGANALAAAWAGEFVSVGGVTSDTTGFAAFKEIKIVPGIRTMAQMRAL